MLVAILGRSIPLNTYKKDYVVLSELNLDVERLTFFKDNYYSHAIFIFDPFSGEILNNFGKVFTDNLIYEDRKKECVYLDFNPSLTNFEKFVTERKDRLNLKKKLNLTIMAV